MRIRWGIAAGAAALILCILLFPAAGEGIIGAARAEKTDTLVIDPGHGGIDGGAVSADGVSEKNINLAIALELQRLAERDGWRVVMTRSKDQGLYTGVENDGTEQMEITGRRSIRSLKTEDLRERRRIIDTTEPTLALSIHLNSFKEDPRVHGAQTFYSSAAAEAVEEKSKLLAGRVQEALVAGLDDGTERTPLGKKNVLLLKEPTVPTVIVECGFLSNREEAKKLADENYQKKIASLIYDGIMEFSGKERAKPLDIIDSTADAGVVRGGSV